MRPIQPLLQQKAVDMERSTDQCQVQSTAVKHHLCRFHTPVALEVTKETHTTLNRTGGHMVMFCVFQEYLFVFSLSVLTM